MPTSFCMLQATAPVRVCALRAVSGSTEAFGPQDCPSGRVRLLLLTAVWRVARGSNSTTGQSDAKATETPAYRVQAMVIVHAMP